jgi:hypothetical protein
MVPPGCQCSNPERSHSEACRERQAKRESVLTPETTLEDVRRKGRPKRSGRTQMNRGRKPRDISQPK